MSNAAQQGTSQEIIDQLVPPKGSKRVAGMVAASVIVLLAVAVYLPGSGIIKPKILIQSRAISASPGAQPAAEWTFLITNNGPEPVNVSSVDLSGQGVTFDHLWHVDGGQRRDGVATIPAHTDKAFVATFSAFDCSVIVRLPNKIPVTAKSNHSRYFTVDVAAPEFGPRTYPDKTSSTKRVFTSWEDGITQGVCG